MINVLELIPELGDLRHPYSLQAIDVKHAAPMIPSLTDSLRRPHTESRGWPAFAGHDDWGRISGDLNRSLTVLSVRSAGIGYPGLWL